jgi:hypothetical protein
VTKPPTDRDLVPPDFPADEPDIPDGMVLGIDLEEFYFFFGESFYLYYVGLRLGHGIPATYVNKLDRIRTTLWSLPGGADLVRQLDDILAQVPTTAQTESERLGAETLKFAGLLDRLMSAVRQALPDDASYWYDLGVFLARLHLCLTILESPPTGFLRQSHDTYLLELRRVVPLFAQAYLRLMDRPSTYSAPAPLIRSLAVLAQDMVAFALAQDTVDVDDGASSWYRTTREHADAAFTAVGMTYTESNMLVMLAHVMDDHQNGAEAKTPTVEPPDPVGELHLRHEQHRNTLFSHQPEAAEEGLRNLLVSARRVLGPSHPLVFMIRADLSLALLELGRVQLSAALALDNTDESVFLFGDHHAVTAAAACNTALVLMATAPVEEVAVFIESRLAWLLAARPDDLSEELRMIRKTILSLFAADERGTQS